MSARPCGRTQEGAAAIPSAIANANTWAICAPVDGSLGQLNMSTESAFCVAPQDVGPRRPYPA